MVKKFITIFTVIAFIIIVTFTLSYQRKIFLVSNGDKAISAERTTFLVLGKTGKVIGWNTSPNLADSIFIVDYHPKNGAVNIVSLPRDLLVNIEGENFKLNEVLYREKLNGLLAQLPEITGISTTKYIVVDIDFVKKIVDEMGGVNVDLKSSLVDWVSGYTIPAGQQHLNGEQVAWAVRNRFAPEGDFFREKNQQEIIRGAVGRFRGLNLFQKTAFVFKMTPELSRLETNIDFQELLPAFDKFNGARFNNVVLDFSTGLLYSGYVDIFTGKIIERTATTIASVTSTQTVAATTSSSTPSISTAAYVLIPRAGTGNYMDIKNYIESKLEK